MGPEQRDQALRQLAATIAHHQLMTPARFLLDIVTPLGFLASQVAVFARPLTPYGRWHDYMTALSDEEGWRILHTLVEDHDS